MCHSGPATGTGGGGGGHLSPAEPARWDLAGSSPGASHLHPTSTESRQSPPGTVQGATFSRSPGSGQHQAQAICLLGEGPGMTPGSLRVSVCVQLATIEPMYLCHGHEFPIPRDPHRCPRPQILSFRAADACQSRSAAQSFGPCFCLWSCHGAPPAGGWAPTRTPPARWGRAATCNLRCSHSSGER